MASLETIISQAITEFVDVRADGNVKAASRKLGITYETLNAWYKGTRSPTIKSISPILHTLGVDLFESGDAKLKKELAETKAELLESQAETREARAENRLLTKMYEQLINRTVAPVQNFNSKSQMNNINSAVETAKE